MKKHITAPLPLRQNMGLALGLIVLPFMLLQLFLPAAWTARCGFLAKTGCPCPTCGTTRSLQLAGRGEFTDAFSMQPLLFISALLFGGWMIYTLAALLFKWPTIRIQLESRREKAAVWGLGIVLITVNWLYLAFTH